jgi:hypothetical protein
MSHHVYATKREGLRQGRAAGPSPQFRRTRRSRPTRFRSQRLFDFSDRQAIDHVIFGEPAFAGNSDSKPQILQSLCAVSIWIDHAFNAFLFG